MTLSAAHGMGMWSTAAWRHLAVAWLDEQLAVTGSQRIGYVGQPHLRPWLKACGTATAFEVGLYGLIGRVTPEHALSPIAADLAPGWIILPDGGPSLGDRFTGSDLADAMKTALAAYGHLQRTIAPHAGDLLDLGITGMRPAIMPRRFEEALQAVGAAERAAFGRVPALRDIVAAWCDELAAASSSSCRQASVHPRSRRHACSCRAHRRPARTASGHAAACGRTRRLHPGPAHCRDAGCRDRDHTRRRRRAAPGGAGPQTEGDTSPGETDQLRTALAVAAGPCGDM